MIFYTLLNIDTVQNAINNAAQDAHLNNYSAVMGGYQGALNGLLGNTNALLGTASGYAGLGDQAFNNAGAAIMPAYTFIEFC